MADRYYDRDDRYGRDYGESSGRGSSRGWDRRDESRARDERGFMDRAGDEVRSWFGDEDAARRRDIDERRDRSSDFRDHPDWRDRWRGDTSSREYGSRDYPSSPARFSDMQPRGWDRRDWDTRDWHDRDEPSRRAFAGTESGWRTSGRGRDYGDDDRAWLNRGPNWGRDFGWGPERGTQTGRSESWRDVSGRRDTVVRSGESSGRFFGRGPKGYQRSDERIREDVCDRLTMHGEVDASDIEVDVKGGEVTLRGSAESRFTRRTAEDIADSVPGVRHVHNEIRVHNGDTSGTGGASGGANAGAGGTAGATAGTRRERV